MARRNLDPVPEDVHGAGGVWAVGIVRDEADIVETVIRNLLAQGVERVVIADNLSTDATASVLERLAGSLPVTVLSDRLAAHYQAEKTTLLARAAARAGAGWVLPFDADEVWTAPTWHRGGLAGGMRRGRGAGAGLQPRADGRGRS